MRQQLADAALPAGIGLVLRVGAGGCLVLRVGAASTSVPRRLETFVPRRLAAWGLTAGYFVAAAVLFRLGLEQLRAAGGSSARLADEVHDTVSATAGRVVPAPSSAARVAFKR